jgi:uncharacterized coiled-coil protein SlyX
MLVPGPPPPSWRMRSRMSWISIARCRSGVSHPGATPTPPTPKNTAMARIDLVALQQRLAQPPPRPSPAEPPSRSARPASASASRTTLAPNACPVTASAAAPAGTLRATTTMRAALPLKATSTRADRAEERARANALRTKIDELNAALAEERQRVDRLNKQVEALSAEVVRAEKQAGAVVGRAERAEAGRDAERARADALADRMHLLQAGLVAAETAAGQARTDAQAAERAHAEASVSLLALSEQLDAYEVEAAHRGRGLLARLWDVLRGD